MMRLHRIPHAIAALGALAFTACDNEPTYTGRIIVDLNRTATGSAMVRSVLADSARAFPLSPDANGVYSFVSDTLPSDIYVLALDSAHVLPLVVTQGAAQRVCGTLREWDALTASCHETSEAIAAEALRRRLAESVDSARTTANMAVRDERRAVADSIGRVRAAFRAEADARLARLADTSLAALPYLGLPGVFDDASDNAMLLRRIAALSDKWPEVKSLALRRDHLQKVSKLNSLRKAYSAGSRVTDFLFISASGDTLSPDGMTGKRMVLAVLPDSASTPRSVTVRLGLLALDGAQVLIDAPDCKTGVSGRNVTLGKFARLSHGGEAGIFKPVVIIVGKDGCVERLSIGK